MPKSKRSSGSSQDGPSDESDITVTKKECRAEANRRRSLEETYTEALMVNASDLKPVSEFMTNFRLHENHYEQEFQKQLKVKMYPMVVSRYNELVLTKPTQVPHKAFLQRYLYRCCDLERIKQDLKEAKRQQAQSDQRDGEEPKRTPAATKSSNELRVAHGQLQTQDSVSSLSSAPRKGILRKSKSGSIAVRFRGDVYQDDLTRRRAAWGDSGMTQQPENSEGQVAPPLPFQRQATMEMNTKRASDASIKSLDESGHSGISKMPKGVLRNKGEAPPEQPAPQAPDARSSMHRTASLPTTSRFRKESNSAHTRKRWDTASNHSPVQERAVLPLKAPRRMDSKAQPEQYEDCGGGSSDSGHSEDEEPARPAQERISATQRPSNTISKLQMSKAAKMENVKNNASQQQEAPNNNAVNGNSSAKRQEQESKKGSGPPMVEPPGPRKRNSAEAVIAAKNARERLKRWNSTSLPKGATGKTSDRSPMGMMQRSYSTRTPAQPRQKTRPEGSSRPVASRPSRSKSEFALSAPKRAESPTPKPAAFGEPFKPRRSLSPSTDTRSRSSSPTPSLVSISTATTAATGVATVVASNVGGSSSGSTGRPSFNKLQKAAEADGGRWQRIGEESPQPASPQILARQRRAPLLPTRSTDDLPVVSRKEIMQAKEAEATARRAAEKAAAGSSSSSTQSSNTTLGVQSVQEATTRRNNIKTYTQKLDVKKLGPHEQRDEFLVYKNDFDLLEWQDQAQIALAMYPDSLARFFLVLVPKKVTLEEFWKRYFWRCDELRILREIRRRQEENT